MGGGIATATQVDWEVANSPSNIYSSSLGELVPGRFMVNGEAEFLGQSTGFRRSKLKPGVIVLAEVEGTEEVKYLHGQFGQGTFTFLGGHDPEDYQHMVGDPETKLERFPHSPGYRLILNNVLFPAAEMLW